MVSHQELHGYVCPPHEMEINSPTSSNSLSQCSALSLFSQSLEDNAAGQLKFSSETPYSYIDGSNVCQHPSTDCHHVDTQRSMHLSSLEKSLISMEKDLDMGGEERREDHEEQNVLKRKREVNSEVSIRECSTSFSNLQICHQESQFIEHLDQDCLLDMQRVVHQNKTFDDYHFGDGEDECSTSPASAAPTIVSDSSCFNNSHLENDVLQTEYPPESFYYHNTTATEDSQEYGTIDAGHKGGAYGWFLDMDQEELDYRCQTTAVTRENSISITDSVDADFSRLAFAASDSMEQMMSPDLEDTAVNSTADDTSDAHSPWLTTESYFSTGGPLTWRT